MKLAVYLTSAVLLAFTANAGTEHTQGDHASEHGQSMMEHGQGMADASKVNVSGNDMESINAVLAQKYGIEIMSVRLTGDNTMIDYRYRVIDADLAAPLHGQHVKTHIIDEATQRQFDVPFAAKIGSLRQTSKAPVQGRTYVILFANPGRSLDHGDKVSIAQADLIVSGLRVE